MIGLGPISPGLGLSAPAMGFHVEVGCCAAAAHAFTKAGRGTSAASMRTIPSDPSSVRFSFSFAGSPAEKELNWH